MIKKTTEHQRKRTYKGIAKAIEMRFQKELNKNLKNKMVQIIIKICVESTRSCRKYLQLRVDTVFTVFTDLQGQSQEPP